MTSLNDTLFSIDRLAPSGGCKAISPFACQSVPNGVAYLIYPHTSTMDPYSSHTTIHNLTVLSAVHVARPPVELVIQCTKDAHEGYTRRIYTKDTCKGYR